MILKKISEAMRKALNFIGKKSCKNEPRPIESVTKLSAMQSERLMALPLRIIVGMWDEYGVGVSVSAGRAVERIFHEKGEVRENQLY